MEIQRLEDQKCLKTCNFCDHNNFTWIKPITITIFEFITDSVCESISCCRVSGFLFPMQCFVFVCLFEILLHVFAMWW